MKEIQNLSMQVKGRKSRMQEKRKEKKHVDTKEGKTTCR